MRGVVIAMQQQGVGSGVPVGQRQGALEVDLDRLTARRCRGDQIHGRVNPPTSRSTISRSSPGTGDQPAATTAMSVVGDLADRRPAAGVERPERPGSRCSTTRRARSRASRRRPRGRPVLAASPGPRRLPGCGGRARAPVPYRGARRRGTTRRRRSRPRPSRPRARAPTSTCRAAWGTGAADRHPRTASPSSARVRRPAGRATRPRRTPSGVMWASSAPTPSRRGLPAFATVEIPRPRLRGAALRRDDREPPWVGRAPADPADRGSGESASPIGAGDHVRLLLFEAGSRGRAYRRSSPDHVSDSRHIGGLGPEEGLPPTPGLRLQSLALGTPEC